MSILKPAQLKAYVKNKQIPKNHFLGVSTNSKWEGSDILETTDNKYHVVSCVSELHIRETMLKMEDKDNQVIIITPLSDNMLSADVLVRFVKRKLFTLNLWENLKAQYDAREIDTRVEKKEWIADTLLNYEPDGEYPIAPNGVMTAEFVWGILLNSILGLDVATPDAEYLLEWLSGNDTKRRIDIFKGLPNNQQLDIKNWIKISSGEIGEIILNSVILSDYSAVSLGLSCEVVYNEMNSSKATLREAVIRLETSTGKMGLKRELALQWAKYANKVIEKKHDSNLIAELDDIYDDLHKILCAVGAEDYEWCSQSSPNGFKQLLEKYAASLNKTMKNFINLSDSLSILELIKKHKMAKYELDCIERIDMSIRLIRYLCHNENTDAAKLEECIKSYTKDGAYIDWARNKLYSGEENQKLSRSYGKLLRLLSEKMEEKNKRFSEKICEFVYSNSQENGFYYIENVLNEVIAKVAKQKNVLLIILDGMSYSVYLELIQDINKHWALFDTTNNEFSRPVISTIPSVTSSARCSLLTGSLEKGAQHKEKSGFQKNSKLKRLSPQKAPSLYYKNELTEAGGAELSYTLSADIASKHNVIGVVINVIDDDLAKGEQLTKHWNLSSMNILKMLLTAADESDRTVILCSDHGHILDRGCKLKKYDTGGERYRLDDGNLNEGECIVEGKRVLSDNQRLIVPWTENLRYADKKNGYHGGISQQEMIVPVSVLCSKEAPSEWIAISCRFPEWWNEDGNKNKASVIEAKRKRKKNSCSDLPLFANVQNQNDSPTSWINDLISSPIYLNQKQLCGRIAPNDERISAFLEILHLNGGKVLKQVMVNKLKQPQFRIAGIISTIQRMLNIDGYQLIEYDANSETISLNLELLKTQFNLD